MNKQRLDPHATAQWLNESYELLSKIQRNEDEILPARTRRTRIPVKMAPPCTVKMKDYKRTA
jgi:hypothetical protein